MTERSTDELLASARQIADDVLFPNALIADQARGVPEMQLQCLVDAGFYGVSTYCQPATIVQLIEILAGGCLTTAFVWVQHLGAAAGAFFSDGPVHDEFADDLTTGRKRGGVAFAHMLRPGTPLTLAEPSPTGWTLTGSAPWVTGWGHVDVVHAAARHGDDIVWLLIDAVESPTLRSEYLPFAVVDATQTRVLSFDRHEVPASRVTKVEHYATWKQQYGRGLRSNGSFALGVAGRGCRLLDEPRFSDELQQTRQRLDDVDATDLEAISAERAAASLFAVRVATALVAKTGGNAVMLADHAQRLLREAMFVLVQGQTPTIKSAMIEQLATK